MDNFECKAPMYVNFEQSSALDEDDGADKFFGNYNKTYKFTHCRCIDIDVLHIFQKLRSSRATQNFPRKNYIIVESKGFCRWYVTVTGFLGFCLSPAG
jgi:hypothetical protein